VNENPPAPLRLLGANPIDRRKREVEIANLCLAIHTICEGLKACIVQCFVTAGLERPKLARLLIARSSTGELASVLGTLFGALRPDAPRDQDSVTKIVERATRLDATWLEIARGRYVIGPISASAKRRMLFPAFEISRARETEEQPHPVPVAAELKALRDEAEALDLELVGLQLAIQSGRAVDDAIRIAKSDRHPFTSNEAEASQGD
jgi:hypothetical protein